MQGGREKESMMVDIAKHHTDSITICPSTTVSRLRAEVPLLMPAPHWLALLLAQLCSLRTTH